MKIIQLVLFLCLASSTVFAACKVGDESSCHATCDFGSTLAPTPGSSSGLAPSGVDAACGISYNTNVAADDAYDLYAPHGYGAAPGSLVAFCFAGSGYVFPTRGNCLLGGGTTARFVEFVQLYGIPIYTFGYRGYSGGTSPAIYPAIWQDAHCVAEWAAANLGQSSETPGNPNGLLLFSASGGTTLAFDILWTANNQHSRNCSNPISTAYTVVRAVSLSGPIDFKAVCDQGGFDQTAIQGELGVGSCAAVATADATLLASPLKAIIQGNYSLLSSTPVYFQTGQQGESIDPSQNAAVALSTALALTPAITWAWWMGPSNHQSDLSCGFGPTCHELPDAFNWLLGGNGRAGGSVGGIAGSGSVQ